MSVEDSSTSLEPIIAQRPPLRLRLAYYIGLWALNAVFQITLRSGRLFFPRRKNLLQSEIKTYAIRPGLKSRVFRPPNSGDEQLPLYLDIHGGGWALADPETDDEICSFLAQNFHIIVVAVDYRRAPRYKLPRAMEDVIAISDAVINDKSLNIDRSKIVLGGFSAGGNLAFAAAQSEKLRGRLSGLVGLYPVIDLTDPLEMKLGRRPQTAPPDILASSANFLAWGYLPDGIDLRNPLISPRYAQLKHLPSHAFLLGAEYDMLCHEAEQMAESLAKTSAANFVRTAVPTLSNEDGWQQGGVRWEVARGKDHAFTHIAKKGREEEDRVKFTQEMYSRLGRWLVNDVWATSSTP